jgi:coproporphyrinogen III oxidase
MLTSGGWQQDEAGTMGRCVRGCPRITRSSNSGSARRAVHEGAVDLPLPRYFVGMHITLPSSVRAADALQVVSALQARLVDHLAALGRLAGAPRDPEPVSWQRDEGRHGGGTRYGVGGTTAFDRASVNVSVVHYDDLPGKALGSATALSAIVHPANPHVPSLHTHVSWTELRDGTGAWRLMADLNPSIVHPEAKATFEAALAGVAPEHLALATAEGERYFYVPALGRTRGVAHFYLEDHATEDEQADLDLARRFGETVIDAYAALAGAAFRAWPEITEADRAAQLAYHTLYFFQVLTLDRGTTSGLLIHDQNDVGILGSLPSHVDRELLASWAPRCPPPQDRLVLALLDVLPETSPCLVSEDLKPALARVLRAHYRAWPEALELQARGQVLPRTVDNHR